MVLLICPPTQDNASRSANWSAGDRRAQWAEAAPAADSRPGGRTVSFRALAFSSPLSGWLLMADILITEEASGEAIEGLKTRWKVEEAPGLWREPAALR